MPSKLEPARIRKTSVSRAKRTTKFPNLHPFFPGAGQGSHHFPIYFPHPPIRGTLGAFPFFVSQVQHVRSNEQSALRQVQELSQSNDEAKENVPHRLKQ